jgi:hypothetical protein
LLKQEIFFFLKKTFFKSIFFNSFKKKNIFDKKHPDMEECSKFILLTIIHLFSFISFLWGMNQNIPGRTHIRSRSPRSKASGQ